MPLAAFPARPALAVASILVFLHLLLPVGLTAQSPATRTGPEVLFSGRPEPSLLSSIDHLIVTTEHTLLVRNVPLRDEDLDAYLLAVPEGQLTWSFQEVVVRSRYSGELVNAIGKADFMGSREARTGIQGRVKLTDFGTMRGLRLALLTFDRRTPLHINRVPYEVASYKILIEYPSAPEPVTTPDQSIEGGLFRQFMETAIANPALIDRFARPIGESPFPTTSSWQPLPELSPEFPWLKIPISETGLYAIDGRWLLDNGLDPGSIRPEELYIVSEGKQVAREVIGLEGAGFEGGQRVVFHAVANDSEETAERVYFLGRRPDFLEPRSFARGPRFAETAPEMASYARRFVAQKDLLLETRLGTFLSIRSMVWVWEHLQPEKPAQVTFDLPGYIAAQQPGGKVPITIHLYFAEDRIPLNSRMTVQLNGRVVRDDEVMERYLHFVKLEVPADALDQTQNQMSILYTPGDQRTKGKVALDNLEVHYNSQFSAQDGVHVVDFSSAGIAESGPRRLRGIGFRTQRLAAIDVTDPTLPVRLESTDHRGLSFVMANVTPQTQLLLAENDLVPRAPQATSSRWQDWRLADHSADILVIYHHLFAEAAEVLAGDLRAQGHEVVTADVEGIYESYNLGNLSWKAVRNFIADATHHWSGRRPVAVLLIGDTTGDGRNISRSGILNYMPSASMNAGSRREEDRFASDQVYAWMNEGDEVADLIVSRLSVATPEEAMAVANNIVAHRRIQDTPSAIGSTMTTIADSLDFRNIVERIHEKYVNPAFMNEFLFADDAVWEDNYFLPPELIMRDADRKVSSQMSAMIENAINEGRGVVAFFGHGAPNLWSNQRFWFGGGTRNSDILRLQNQGRLPYVVSFTCNNAVIDYPLKPWNICIAEDFMRHEGKGAVAAFMPSGPGYVRNHGLLADGFYRAWTQLGVREMSLLAELSRINYQARSGFDDHSRMFIYLGDPMLRIPPPGDDATRDFRRDQELDRTGGDLLILDVVESQESEESDALSHSWNVVLSNASTRRKILTLRANLLGAGGQSVDHHERFISVQPLESRMETVTLTAPKAGPYYVSFEIPHDSGRYYRDFFPTRKFEQGVFFGRVEGPLDLVEGSVRIKPAQSRKGGPRVEVAVANPGRSLQNGTLVAVFKHGSQVVRTESRSMQSLRGGMINPVAFPLENANLESRSTNVSFHLRQLDESSKEEKEIDRIDYRIDYDKLPDIYIDEASIKFSPEDPSEGMTIFVEGIVGNRGSTLAPQATLGLFAEEDAAFKSPLPDLTRQGAISFGPLKPGERQPFRLRWDPQRNAGRYSIVVAADPDSTVLDPNRRNNSTRVSLHVKTKWNLVAGELHLRPERNRRLVLAAEVGNKGETIARNVTVSFYKSEQQTREGLIGEVTLPTIEPHIIVPAVYEWELRPEDMDLDPSRITFSVSLKGSLQRVSSAE